MAVIAVVNRKGGSGKSTLATHLAAWLARDGERVLLGDVDRQLSTQVWLKQRASTQRGQVTGWTVDPKAMVRPPANTGHVVLDTPGGLRGFDLARVVMYADVIVMPVCHSAFDRAAAAEGFAELQTLPRVAQGRCRIAAVGMRVDSRADARESLKRWADDTGVQLVGALRYSPRYVQAIEEGLTLFDLPAATVKTDLVQWQPILAWVAQALGSLRLESVETRRPGAAKPPADGSINTLMTPATNAAAKTPLPAVNASLRVTQQASLPAPMSLPGSPLTKPPVLTEHPRAERAASAPILTTQVSQLLNRLSIPQFLQRDRVA
jgi:chromosome partitioning protein